MNTIADEQTPWWQLWSCSRCNNSDNTQSEETRLKILQAAFAEIHRVGFQAASVQNILKDTGLTKGALYHHFPNKNALGYAVVDEIISESLHAVWVHPLLEAEDPVATLQQIIRNAGAFFTQEDIELGCPLNNLSQEMSTVDENFRTRLEAIYTNWRYSIENALEKGKETAYVSADINTRQFSIVFIATLEGCIGVAKNSQDMSILMDCGSGLINLLNTLRPQDGGHGDAHA